MTSRASTKSSAEASRRSCARGTGHSIEDYIRAVTEGRVKDRFLSLYRRLGFVFATPLAGYEPDRGSLDYCIFSYRELG